MIRLENVTKYFSARAAVSDLNLHVPAGEVYGLLGHNGAGKSTAIGMMLGQVWPSSGLVEICGHDIASRRRQALQTVGAIFETPAFYDYLSGWRNLEILSSYTGAAGRQRIAEVVDWVGLSDRIRSRVRTYSHGMRARLALAQALLPRPNLLILDEPSDGLDPEGIHEMRLTIQRLHREMKLTILLSSHFLNEVEQLCTRIAVMNQGRKVFEGPLSATRHLQRWYRLNVSDFPAAARLLAEGNLTCGERDNAFVALAEHVTSDVVVKLLVESGIRVFEVVSHERTLEDFYLGLMQEGQTGNEDQDVTEKNPERTANILATRPDHG